MVLVYFRKLYIKISNRDILTNIRSEKFYEYIFLTIAYLFLISINPIIFIKKYTAGLP